MKCPKCVEEGEKSRVYEYPGGTTLMGTHSYYDEDGKWHHHDPNYTNVNYRCTNDHVWSSKERHYCWCEEKQDPKMSEVRDAKKWLTIDDAITTSTETVECGAIDKDIWGAE